MSDVSNFYYYFRFGINIISSSLVIFIYRSFQTKRKILDWTRPSIILPHGISGIISSILGTVLISNSFLGRFAIYETSFLLFYVFFIGVNAISGLILSLKHRESSRRLFQIMSIFQINLIYYCWRFSIFGKESVLDQIVGISLIACILISNIMSSTTILNYQTL